MESITVTIDGRSFTVELPISLNHQSEIPVIVDGREVEIILPEQGDRADQNSWVIVDNRPYEINYDQDLGWLKTFSGLHEVEIRDGQSQAARVRSSDGRIKAPIPGLVTRLLVKVGDEVETGQPLLVLEAMKMENEIQAPFAGTIDAIHVDADQSVTRNEVMIELSE